MERAVRVGLVGAGPWASLYTAPLLAAGPDCELAGVWARRGQAAERLAHRHGVPAAASLDELFERCDAVAFAVPPDVQADLASRAAAAGLAVLLDKPLGLELAQAERLADTVAVNGVASQLMLTNRYRASARDFLAASAGFGATAGRAAFLGGGAIPGGVFATPWRLERGGLVDLGPHVLDALDAALGTVVDLRAGGDPLGVVALTCFHESGAVSQAVLSVTTPVEPSGLVVELYGPAGRLGLDTAATDASDGGRDVRGVMATVAREFAAVVRSGTPHELDVWRGLHLQRLIEDAATQLRSGGGGSSLR